ncbi:MAG: c-type cytochrome [Thermodesulfobacteriota bacterium]
MAQKYKKKNPAFVFGLTVLLVCFLYTLFANSIPQIEFHPPERVNITPDMSQRDLVRTGKKILNDKGKCLLCHTIGGGGLRAPDLAGIGKGAEERKKGYSSEDYLFESLYYPSIYVVEGYVPSMPPVNKPPINLSDEEIVAIVSFLQSLGGEVTVKSTTKPNSEKIGKKQEGE